MSPSAWASDWSGRPQQAVDIGLRFVSDADIQIARADAAKQAWLRHPLDEDVDNRTDAFNDALLRWVVARGTCKPSDSTIPWFRNDVDSAIVELSVGGAKFLFDAIETLALEHNPIAREATDEELDGLVVRVADGNAFAKLPIQRARQARRLLARAIELMRVD